MPSQMAALRSSLSARDAAAVQLVPHSIKGAAGNIGGERLQRVALQMERAAQAGDLLAAAEHLSELEVEFCHLQAAIVADEKGQP